MTQKPKLSIVVPVYNEEKGLGFFYETASAALRNALCANVDVDCDYEFIFVNDGSTDRTLGIMERF